MCLNCLSTAEAAVCQVAFVGYVIKEPVHRALAQLGLVDEPDPVARDVRTVAFLRQLDLDPVAILGADAVVAADNWVPVPVPRRQPTGWRSRWRLAASARPIGSHSLITAQ
jgi:hypothetical protein